MKEYFDFDSEAEENFGVTNNPPKRKRYTDRQIRARGGAKNPKPVTKQNNWWEEKGVAKIVTKKRDRQYAAKTNLQEIENEGWTNPDFYPIIDSVEDDGSVKEQSVVEGN